MKKNGVISGRCKDAAKSVKAFTSLMSVKCEEVRLCAYELAMIEAERGALSE